MFGLFKSIIKKRENVSYVLTDTQTQDIGSQDGDVRYNVIKQCMEVKYNDAWNKFFMPLSLCLEQDSFEHERELFKKAIYERRMMNEYESVKDAYKQFQFMINMCKDANKQATETGEVTGFVRNPRPSSPR